MSTNDSAILLANGRTGNSPLGESSKELPAFRNALADVMVSLAKSIVRDGEGATKVIEIEVSGARTKEEAKLAAYAVGRSNLVKTAFFGRDPNWGRIISAVGSADLPIDPEKVELLFEGQPLFRKGTGIPGNEKLLAEIMKKSSIFVEVKLGMGNSSFRVFASDLSHEYIDINALYST
jgi:glutamate N-acetyltransferase/amino-acid N-acetyltransferase